MNKLNVQAPSFTNLSAVESDASIRAIDLDLARSRRLIVLIPPDSDCTGVTRRICRLASETNSDIQLLGLCKDPNQELALRRGLATIAALIRDAKVYVEMKVEIGTNWLDVVKRNYQEGDMIVCIVEQPIGIRRRPLSQILESTFKAPVYILSNVKYAQSQSNVLSQVITWCGFIGIIASFFILQVKITQLPKDWFQTLLFILLLIPEFGLIWVWNSLFS
ncbi:MAG TPA: hypothetical protein VK206_05100 [Anaerolineales bacterium]|nr:hypothetical protein [Anaerolineales bacterium]